MKYDYQVSENSLPLIKKALAMPDKKINGYSKRIKFNYLIADYLKQIYDKQKYKDDSLLKEADRIENCGKCWTIEYHRLHQIKDVLKINLCGNKFCFNCQSVKANVRFAKFSPVIDKYVKQGFIPYHFVFTVPNPKADDLKSVLDSMYTAFKKINRYFLGLAKIRGYDFVKMFGYAGTIKSLEITYNSQTRTFHPHFHCLVMCNKKIAAKKNIVNKFSYSDGKIIRKFSDEEVLIQKIWWILNNGKKVDKVNINSLDVGYSVIINPFDDKKFIDSEDVKKINETNSYHEVFKYTLKGNYKKGKKFMTPEVLEVLRDVLYRRRVIQGHGIFYNYDFEEIDLEQEKITMMYYRLKAFLNQIDKPIEIIEDYEKVGFNIRVNSEIVYISKSNVKKIIDLEEIISGE